MRLHGQNDGMGDEHTYQFLWSAMLNKSCLHAGWAAETDVGGGRFESRSREGEKKKKGGEHSWGGVAMDALLSTSPGVTGWVDGYGLRSRYGTMDGHGHGHAMWDETSKQSCRLFKDFLPMIREPDDFPFANSAMSRWSIARCGVQGVWSEETGAEQNIVSCREESYEALLLLRPVACDCAGVCDCLPAGQLTCPRCWGSATSVLTWHVTLGCKWGVYWWSFLPA